MSRRPDMETIGEVRELAGKLRRAFDTLQDARVAAAKIPALQEQWEIIQRELMAKMEDMDCRSPGNFGYENRMASFFMGLDEAYNTPPTKP